jgi:glycosyltransferase involved in cell wall biosynthesis
MKKKLKLRGSKAAIFLGTDYPPNVEAATFIITEVAPYIPEVDFIIAGSVGQGRGSSDLPGNVTVTGFLTEETKLEFLLASDVGVNPMLSGSGTNIKMFDFMAAGLPIVSTDVGGRGIEQGSYRAIRICEPKDFVACTRSVLDQQEVVSVMGRDSRRLAEERYSWERISSDVGLLVRESERKVRRRPFFSVVVPTYNRLTNLDVLMGALSAQGWRDFEVVVVDQSDTPWDKARLEYSFDLTYIHTLVRGAVKARNKGAFFASGEVLAFVDDDCVPDENWLRSARPYFDSQGVVGVEGLIKCDRLDDGDWRAVTNEGFEGIGFMSANLFLRTEVFCRINGFDEQFDDPHFREDTDLAWRALAFGAIPFGDGVRVYHPAHDRRIGRESAQERNRFFEKDVLLLRKHPEKYLELFLKEGHWLSTPGFWDNFLRGAQKYDVDVHRYRVMDYYNEWHAGRHDS